MSIFLGLDKNLKLSNFTIQLFNFIFIIIYGLFQIGRFVLKILNLLALGLISTFKELPQLIWPFILKKNLFGNR